MPFHRFGMHVLNHRTPSLRVSLQTTIHPVPLCRHFIKPYIPLCGGKRHKDSRWTNSDHFCSPCTCSQNENVRFGRNVQDTALKCCPIESVFCNIRQRDLKHYLSIMLIYVVLWWYVHRVQGQCWYLHELHVFLCFSMDFLRDIFPLFLIKRQSKYKLVWFASESDGMHMECWFNCGRSNGTVVYRASFRHCAHWRRHRITVPVWLNKLRITSDRQHRFSTNRKVQLYWTFTAWHTISSCGHVNTSESNVFTSMKIQWICNWFHIQNGNMRGTQNGSGTVCIEHVASCYQGHTTPHAIYISIEWYIISRRLVWRSVDQHLWAHHR